MYGWYFTIYRQAGGGVSPGNGASIKGESLCSWTCGIYEDQWFTDLIKAGKALSYGNGWFHPDGGHTAMAKDLRPQVGDVFAESHPEEWLLIDVGDLSW